MTTMRRRDFVKAIVAASATARAALGQQVPTQVAPATPPPVPTAPGPVPWMRGLMEVKPLSITAIVPDAVANTDTHFFTPQQTATLRRLCEILIPPLKGYPGAIDAGTPEFLDFLISVSPTDRQQMYQSGLDRLDTEAKQRFGTPFCNVEQSTGRSITPTVAQNVDDGPPSNRALRVLHQHRAQRHPHSHHQLRSLEPGRCRERTAHPRYRPVLVSHRPRHP